MKAEEGAAAVLAVATENMVAAIEEITVNQGIDPRGAVLVGGGGAAGFNAVAIARRLGCTQLLVPAVGATLSAVGALISDLSTDRARVLFMRSDALDIAAVNDVLANLARAAEAFARGPGAGAVETKTEFVVEARYPQQTWEIEVPLRQERFDSAEQLRQLVDDFHTLHRELYAVDDPTSPIELVTWRVRVHCRLQATNGLKLATPAGKPTPAHRAIYLRGLGRVSATLRRLDHLSAGEAVKGPAVIESDYTTVMLDDGASARRLDSGSLLITP
jgi:N-methylhydantoinase A